MLPLCQVLGWALYILHCFPSLELYSFHREASRRPEGFCDLHRLSLEEEEEPGSEDLVPQANPLTTTWSLPFVTAPLPAVPLGQMPQKLFLTLFQVSASPRLTASSQTPDKFPAAFLLLLLLWGIVTISTVLALGGSFLYLSVLWRENCLTYPRECPKLSFATSTSTFISSLSIWRWRQNHAFWILWVSAKCNHYFFLFLITGDCFEQPSYWFCYSLTSSFQLLFEAWRWCASVFASNCLRGLINEVDDSQILPCFLRDMLFSLTQTF